MVTLLFSADEQLLAEVYFQAERLSHMSVSPLGEERFGQQLQAWQLQGAKTDAFFSWAAEAGCTTVRLPERLFPAWQKLCLVALDSEERFASLRALLVASHDELQAWDRALDKTIA